MLPYLELPTLGPITSFGILAMLGLVFASTTTTWHAQRVGLDANRIHRMGTYCAIGAVLGAHYVDVFLYQPGWYDKPDAVWIFLNPFSGISSYGGLLGGTLGFWLFTRKEKGKRLRYADVAALGVVAFLTFGRAGCASVHDHVGVATDFALAVDFPRGSGYVGPHHDLGLYEFALFLLVLLPMSLWFLRTPRRAGVYVGIVAIAYAVPRFFMDALRYEIDNPRYAALTPAQWGCIATVVAAAIVLWRSRRSPEPPPYETPTPWRSLLFSAVRSRRTAR